MPWPLEGRERQRAAWFCAPTVLALSSLAISVMGEGCQVPYHRCRCETGRSEPFPLLSEESRMLPQCCPPPRLYPLQCPRRDNSCGQTTGSDDICNVSEAALPLAPCPEHGVTGRYYPGSLQSHPCQRRDFLQSTGEETTLLPRANRPGRRHLSCRPTVCCKELHLKPFLFRQQGLPVLRKLWGGLLPPRGDGGLCRNRGQS